MASKKLTKKVYKVSFCRNNSSLTCHRMIVQDFKMQVIKKGSKHKGFVRNGLKDVQVQNFDQNV